MSNSARAAMTIGTILLFMLAPAFTFASACLGIENVYKITLAKQTQDGIIVQLNWQEVIFGNPAGKKGTLEVLDDDGYLSYYLAYVKLRDNTEDASRPVSEKETAVLSSMLRNATHLKTYILAHPSILNASSDEKTIRQKILGAIEMLEKLATLPTTTIGDLDKINRDLRYYASSAAYKTREKGSDEWKTQTPFSKLELPAIDQTKDLSCRSSISVFYDSAAKDNSVRGVASDSN